MITKIRAITLDLDNTLWDVFPTLRKAEQNSHRYLSQYYPRVAERFSVDDIAALRERIYTTRQDLQHDVTEIRRRLYIEMLTECDYDPSDADQLLSRFIVDRNKVELYPDALPALQAISRAYPIIALSDGNADLHVIGISQYFAGSVFATDIGVAKPHPAGFIRACELAGFAPSETLHIGDNPVADIVGARQAGLLSMWVQRNGETWTEDIAPDYKVNTLMQAVDILC